jgi:hypothetical protein
MPHSPCHPPCRPPHLGNHPPSSPQGYKELYSRKWAYTRELAASIQAGLQKMVEAKEDVNKMKAELAVKNQARGERRPSPARSPSACPRVHAGRSPHVVPPRAAVWMQTQQTLVALNQPRGSPSQHRRRRPPPKPPQELAVASREAEALLRSISESTAIAEKEKAKVAVIVGDVSAKAAEIAAVKNDAERDLAAAKPALDDALSALNRCEGGRASCWPFRAVNSVALWPNHRRARIKPLNNPSRLPPPTHTSIRPSDITSLKALKSPPDIVKRIFDCVLLLRYWPINSVRRRDWPAGALRDVLRLHSTAASACNLPKLHLSTLRSRAARTTRSLARLLLTPCRPCPTRLPTFPPPPGVVAGREGLHGDRRQLRGGRQDDGRHELPDGAAQLPQGADQRRDRGARAGARSGEGGSWGKGLCGGRRACVRALCLTGSGSRLVSCRKRWPYFFRGPFATHRHFTFFASAPCQNQMAADPGPDVHPTPPT